MRVLLKKCTKTENIHSLILFFTQPQAARGPGKREGDNSKSRLDSRYYGPIPVKDVRSKMIYLMKKNF